MSKHRTTCNDCYFRRNGLCYFRRNGLCALVLERPCPTFRAAGQTLQPPPQPQLVPRPLPLVAAAASA
jgi:hypothetical protein